MPVRLRFIPLLLLMAATLLAQTQEPAAPPPAAPKLFELPVIVAQGRRVIAFEFSAGGRKYRIALNGMGIRADGAGAQQTFNLHLSKGDFIRKLYYSAHADDALLLLEVTNGVYGVSFLARIGGAAPGIKWKQTVPGFNVGRGLVEGDFAYVTALRFVAKVDLRSGAYAWRHAELRHEGAFDAFDPPRLEGDTVLFPAWRSRASERTIAVEKESGRILGPPSLVQARKEKQR